MVSAAGLRCLTSKFQIFPAFYELVQAFGDKSAHAPRAVAAVQVSKSRRKEGIFASEGYSEVLTPS